MSKQSYVLPRSTSFIVRGYCIGFDQLIRDVERGTATVSQLMTKDRMNVAISHVLRGEEHLAPLLIRCIARRTPFSRCPRELMDVYSEATYKRRKRDLSCAIAQAMELL